MKKKVKSQPPIVGLSPCLPAGMQTPPPEREGAFSAN